MIIYLAAPPPPKTINKEWEEASNQRALEQKMNPISGELSLLMRSYCTLPYGYMLTRGSVGKVSRPRDTQVGDSSPTNKDSFLKPHRLFSPHSPPSNKQTKRYCRTLAFVFQMLFAPSRQRFFFIFSCLAFSFKVFFSFLLPPTFGKGHISSALWVVRAIMFNCFSPSLAPPSPGGMCVRTGDF